MDPVSRFLSVYSPLEVRWERLDPPGPVDGGVRRLLYRGLRLYRRRLALEEGRRRRPGRRGPPDFKRTMRLSLRTFGEAVRIARSRRKRSRSRLLVLLDVSNSMRDYWPWIQALILALRGLPTGSYEVFVFSTRLVRITGIIESGGGDSEVLEAVIREAGVWGSGTRIGEALKSLVDDYPSYVDRRTGVLIVSDGWDLGDLGVLEESLRELRKRSGYIAWITPHASSEGFSPSTACLRIALNYVDDLLPTSALEDPRMLSRLVRPRRR